MDITNLTSGFLGALVGSIISAIATYKATIKGAQVSLEGSVNADREQRKRDTTD